MKIVQVIQARDAVPGDRIMTENGWRELQHLDHGLYDNPDGVKLCWDWDDDEYYASDYTEMERTDMLVVIR